MTQETQDSPATIVNQPSRRRERLTRWVPEISLVIVSAALGFGAAQYGEHRNEQQLVAQITRGLTTELAENLAQLEPMVPFHNAWLSALNAAHAEPNQSGLDVWFATRPPIPTGRTSPFVVLRRSAWDAAVAGGSLRLLDYERTAALSEVYSAQEILEENVRRLAEGALTQTATYDPASRRASVRLLWLTLADIHAAEVRLLELYRRHLPRAQGADASASR